MIQNKLLTNIVRLGYLGWFVFELLNWVGVLHFQLAFTWFGLLFTLSVVWLLVELVSWRSQRTSGQPLPWFVFLGALLSLSFDAMGDIQRWYITYGWYDQVAHALGGGMAAMIVFYTLWHSRQAGRMVMGKRMVGFFAVASTIALGTFYELEEYLEDVIRGVVNVRLGDGPDTANDMLWNMIGAVIVVAVIVFFVRRVTAWRAVREEVLPEV